MLRAQEYSAVIIDESLLEREPAESETVLQHIGMAVPIHINFAISGIDRVVRELSAARYRRTRSRPNGSRQGPCARSCRTRGRRS